ncbi:Phosphoesterase family protein [Lacipirellula limnantheis]|uniref:Phosphoesterase family protein n=2 Tax=Lacipirellula limnantheis TaxID=2528024 RepID=A0A517TXZ2_9BACT|nr:Phosphoesterase family protein [Lacipirellula limnantheis]
MKDLPSRARLFRTTDQHHPEDARAGDMNALRLTAIVLGTVLCTPSVALSDPPEIAETGSLGANKSPARRLPGQQSGGEILLPTQWSLMPAGKQIALGDFPVNVALHPKEPWAAVLHAGFGAHEIVIVDLSEGMVVSRVVLPQCFYGLCFDPQGKRLFASGGEFAVVHQFQFADGLLSDQRRIQVADPNKNFIPAGLACSVDGQSLFSANAWGDTLARISLSDPAPPKHHDLGKDSYPYAPLPSPDGKRVFVSLWNQSAVAVFDVVADKFVGRWSTASHPTEMTLSPDAKELYVACANGNTVVVLDADTGDTLETINSALYPQAPHGSTPNSLALSPNGKVLFIANADNNNLAVIDVSERGRSRSLGYIPVGWYPTSVRYSAVDNHIYVANGKGLSPKANRQGPNPLIPAGSAGTLREYIGGLLRGTLSVIPAPSPEEMARYTKQTYKCSPLKSDRSAVTKPREQDNPIPAKVGDASPIKHCVYIIKENRTYDQVFGDLPKGNGDASLCLFPERVTPNHHALARQFVTLDNFYVEGEVSADGHEWTMAAYATDFVEKTWPLNYRKGGRGIFRYPSEGALPIAFSAGGYIWDRCKEREVTYRSYGEFVANAEKAGDPGTVSMPALEGHFDPLYRSFDMEYSDVDRAKRFITELRQFEQAGEMPRLIVMRLPNDHTSGTKVGAHTPIAAVGDNDLALGLVVEALSHSKFWKETAIFVVEDDAQNGSDHVDAHRTVALVISPFTKREHVDSNMYSTASMLRTMELILGLEPMSQFDAAALPMYESFQPKADLRPYDHRAANVDLNAVNAPEAPLSDLSAKLDFSREDAADDLVLNQIVWKAVRGPDSVMPAPVRAGFFFARPGSDEDDDDD